MHSVSILHRLTDSGTIPIPNYDRDYTYYTDTDRVETVTHLIDGQIQVVETITYDFAGRVLKISTTRS